MLRKSFVAGLIFLAATFAFIISATAQTQTARQMGDPAQVTDPTFRDYKGITLDMTANEVHQKLGAPKETGGGQDFYSVSDKEAVQIFYSNISQKVKAIAISYLGEGSGAPDCRSILGIDVTPAADGSIYKLVRYPKAGYWVSYNRTGGDAPLVAVTIQKITP